MRVNAEAGAGVQSEFGTELPDAMESRGDGGVKGGRVPGVGRGATRGRGAGGLRARCAAPCPLFRTSGGRKRRACERVELAETGERGLEARWCVRERLLREDWERLLSELASYARWQVRRWRWGGPLPLGYDARGIAAESIGRVFSGEGRVRSNYRLSGLVRELRRLVRGAIRRLHKRVEVRVTRSEWKFVPSEGQGQWRSVLAGVAGAEADGAQDLVRREGGAAQASWCNRLEEALAGDGDGLGVLRCLREGMRSRAAIAARLGISVSAVTNARKRLARKLREIKIER
jgi:hypothetical protein